MVEGGWEISFNRAKFSILSLHSCVSSTVRRSGRGGGTADRCCSHHQQLPACKNRTEISGGGKQLSTVNYKEINAETSDD